MRTQTEGRVVTVVMKREFQTHKIITLSFAYIHFFETTVKFKLCHTASHEDKNLSISRGKSMISWQNLFSFLYITKYMNYEI